MGMFDTFHIQDRGRQLTVQSKQFAQVLGEYRLGDFVGFDQATPTGVRVSDHLTYEHLCYPKGATNER